MALSDAKRRANDKYIAAHYERLPVSYSREFCADVRAAAQASGQTLAGYVRSALVAYMAARVLVGQEETAPSQPAPDEPAPPAHVTVEPVKRKPGRPRKVQPEQPAPDAQQQPKRGRGRPRKDAPTE